MKNIWFTSDLHFDHTNIIKYCNRPFSSADEMNEALIDGWNSCATENDIVYHLGDFCFSRNVEHVDSLMTQLKGTKRLIKGNHDKRNMYSDLVGKAHSKVEWFRDIHNEQIGDRALVLSHFPFAVWDRKHHGSIHLHGHSHGTYQGQGKIIDVGIDHYAKLFGTYKLWHIDEVLALADTKIDVPVDHHI